MDVYEATRVVLARIQSLDAENAAKIMGYILIQEQGDKEMIRLAFGPDALLQSVVLKARSDLGLPGSPLATSAPTTPSPFSLLARQNSSSRFSSLGGVSSPTSFLPPSGFSCSGRGLDELQGTEEILSPNGAGKPFMEEFQLQDQLSFLSDSATSPNPEHPLPIGPKSAGDGGDLFYPDVLCRSPRGVGDDLFYPDVFGRSPSSGSDSSLFPCRFGWATNGNHHRRSWSSADLLLRSDAAAGGFGWKPCLYFAKGYCKDGPECRFLHGLPEESIAAAEHQRQLLLLRSMSQRIGRPSQLTASAFPYSPLGSLPSSPSSTTKSLDFLLQQQNDSQSRAAAAAALLRSRMERSDIAGMTNPGSRQIYLTFPADSTFTEEDVSNYFSIYGPVQDVRIPYQQKRMFGFVTFIYPETVKVILAKGNPHFVCDARVLVKPYKEKGKALDKCRKQQLNERGEFSGCTTPTGLESRGDPYDLQPLGARMLYNNGSQELLRRKLEEQQQALELQRAIELQARRLMNLQLLDLKNRSLSSSTAPASIINPPTISAPFITIPTADSSSKGSSSSSSSQEHSPIAGAEQNMNTSNGFSKAVNSSDKKESVDEVNPNQDSDSHESAAEHNLPDSPFTSPTKSSIAVLEVDAFSHAAATVPPSSTFEMASYKSCVLAMPRLSSHGAMGM
ncbi:zinc finger CCCH domain-containing protein 53-like isoform X1 [Zingiber officinale]|uniref:zinc finger CCCH domain-containing protein 53-like isoform X1 n=1 Tax=Zingiber officinale TaxID=94328 RepID=UPI001C4CF437|nr:zinc finger CCCH domain-containing protein 53-like isoform X1 [Zingiber officinale]XP_042409250.1 zinc finger CCCH domain-containing protein 53-like isoform X1 [Zingiber officinale]XP_042409251.1 zinc finger CCCH domain-containing protein 53-like isoform X1 [Zingiber officinale]